MDWSAAAEDLAQAIIVSCMVAAVHTAQADGTRRTIHGVPRQPYHIPWSRVPRIMRDTIRAAGSQRPDDVQRLAAWCNRCSPDATSIAIAAIDAFPPHTNTDHMEQNLGDIRDFAQMMRIMAIMYGHGPGSPSPQRDAPVRAMAILPLIHTSEYRTRCINLAWDQALVHGDQSDWTCLLHGVDASATVASMWSGQPVSRDHIMGASKVPMWGDAMDHQRRSHDWRISMLTACYANNVQDLEPRHVRHLAGGASGRIGNDEHDTLDLLCCCAPLTRSLDASGVSMVLDAAPESVTERARWLTQAMLFMDVRDDRAMVQRWCACMGVAPKGSLVGHQTTYRITGQNASGHWRYLLDRSLPDEARAGMSTVAMRLIMHGDTHRIGSVMMSALGSAHSR